jgi:hypothetical protein
MPGTQRRKPYLRDGKNELLVYCWAGCNSLAVLKELRQLGLLDDRCITEPPRRTVRQVVDEKPPHPDWWRKPWQAARPIAGTLAEVYLRNRGLEFDDPEGRVLRFHPQRARENPDGEFERHPALLAALRNVRVGEQVGIINVYLQKDGHDRIRDKKGKTVTGRAKDAVVMLSAFDEPTMGLVLCEGAETGIALFQQEMRPIWACGGATTLAKFPLLGGIESLTIAADTGKAGQQAAEELAQHWREAGREALVITAPVDDWATPDE